MERRTPQFRIWSDLEDLFMAELFLTRRRLIEGALTAVSVTPALGWADLAWAQANQTLRIGMSAPNTTFDPHLQSNAPNNAVATHIFDTVVNNDENSRSAPGLATSWRVLDDNHWEFELRPNVRFSDGTPLTPEDISVSIDRATTIPSTASFRTYTRSIKAITSPEPGKLLVETKTPDPLLPNSLSRVRIISARFKDAPSSDFNAGRAAIGTGPYVFREYVPGSRIVLAANPNSWGPRPPWSDVVIRIVTDPGARLAALLSGDLDLIEQVPYEGIDRVNKDPRFQIVRGVSSRFVYLAMDTSRDVTPFITDMEGKPLPKNPLKDRRVRQALSIAINRQAIVDRVMEGNAIAASQFLPPGAPGTSPDVKPAPYDPNKAKAMLAEAGYPKGFRLTIHGPNDRIVNDSKIVQAAAQMFARIGIETRVEVMPWSVYSNKNNTNEFSVSLNSWGVNTGETSNPMLALVATANPSAGTGASNSGRYSNPELDAKLTEAMKTLDEAKRNKLLSEASEIVFTDQALLPLHHEMLVVAARKGLTYTTRADQYTLAMDVKPVA
jgi:peptide/nickel transport system substrate-binding protein